MNAENFLSMLCELDGNYIEEAVLYQASRRASRSRRILAACVPAVLSVFLVGGGVAAALCGENIQSLFGYYWEMVTGKPMSEGHNAVIGRLTQQIGISETAGDITVTVDSAAVGDGNFFLLLKASGMGFSDRRSYGFQNAFMEFYPDPVSGGCFAGYGIDYLGVDKDGAALFLLHYDYTNGGGYQQDTSPLQVELRLQKLVSGVHTDREKIWSEGEWYFSFVIDRSEPLERIALPDTEVTAEDLAKHEKVLAVVTNIELTNTGLRFEYEYRGGELILSDSEISVALKNGSVVGTGNVIGSVSEDNTSMGISCHWLVPVDLDEVLAVQIGDVRIDVASVWLGGNYK